MQCHANIALHRGIGLILFAKLSPYVMKCLACKKSTVYILFHVLVLMAMLKKILKPPAYDTVFTHIYRRLGWLLDPEDWGRKIFRTAGEYLLIYTASYSRRLKSSLIFLINVTNLHSEELWKVRVTVGQYGPLLCIYGDTIRWIEWWKNLSSCCILIVKFVL